jgi:hypothetical protein
MGNFNYSYHIFLGKAHHLGALQEKRKCPLFSFCNLHGSHEMPEEATLKFLVISARLNYTKHLFQGLSPSGLLLKIFIILQDSTEFSF